MIGEDLQRYLPKLAAAARKITGPGTQARTTDQRLAAAEKDHKADDHQDQCRTADRYTEPARNASRFGFAGMFRLPGNEARDQHEPDHSCKTKHASARSREN